jgi:RHS repeat-associated protein
VTDKLRSSSWNTTAPLMQAPAWAVATKPVYASAAKPVEVRESLGNLTTLAEDKPSDLYTVPNLIALASPRGGAADPARMIVAASFHAHPFQEPATGINYVRSRWFDTRSGVWLTPDPGGYTDSPNVYAYAGGDPVNHRDPTGRYEADMHFGITKFLALRAGFSTRDAQIIAYSAQLPDLLEGTDPVITSARYYRDVAAEQVAKAKFDTAAADEYHRSAEMRYSCLRLLHFPRTDSDPKKVLPMTAEAQQLSKAGIEAGNMKLFGLGLHPLQDSFAHQGIPSLPGAISGHPEEHGGFLSHQADQPQYRPDMAIDAAYNTYNMMLSFREKNGGSDFSGPAASWASVEAELREYVYLENISEKRMWLAKHNVAMPDSYWHDVTPGPKDQEGLSDWQKKQQTLESILDYAKKVWNAL